MVLLHWSTTSLVLGVVTMPQELAVQALPHIVLSGPTRHILKPRSLAPPTVTQQSANILDAGVPIYVNTVGIATANAFMTTFFSALILIAITLVLLAVIYGVIALCSRTRLLWVKTQFPIVARSWELWIVGSLYAYQHKHTNQVFL